MDFIHGRVVRLGGGQKIFRCLEMKTLSFVSWALRWLPGKTSETTVCFPIRCAIGIDKNMKHVNFLCLVAIAMLTLGDVTEGRSAEYPLQPLIDQLKPTRKIVYKQVGARKLHLHVFEPDRFHATDKRPAYVAFHGGGWTGGDATRFYPFAAHFAKQGMVGISVEYRLKNDRHGTTVFDCVKDGRSAIRYVREHAAELGIDPDKIVGSGGSAGGHVAVSTALFDAVNAESDNQKTSAVPNALVLYYPVIDTSADGYGQKKIGDRWKELSPVHNVKQKLPPTIIFHGTGDTVTPFKGAKSFLEQTIAIGNSCELVTHKDGRHGYLIFDLKLYREALQQTETFLTRVGMLTR